MSPSNTKIRLFSVPMLLAALVFFCMPVAAESWLTRYPAKAMDWYTPAEQKIASKAKLFDQAGKGKAKNVILFVGDGMGVSTVTAARIFAGQLNGQTGEEYELAFDRFPFSGLAKTYNTNLQVPDSAGTMTALVTGVKTKAGVLSINDNVVPWACGSQKGNELLSALEFAEIAGKSTGIVSTARITHATPAATYASAVSRDWENDSKIPAAEKAAGCDDIASQLVGFDKNLRSYLSTQKSGAPLNPKGLQKIDGPDVVLGGGLRHFLPKGLHHFGSGLSVKGRRGDGRNLIEEWQQLYAHGKFVSNKAQLNVALAEKSGKILGLFSDSHMAYDAHRRKAIEQKAPEGEQPSLEEMTLAALKVLQKNPNGYFLMVEAGRIDHSHHAGNAYNALSDTVAYSDAVRAAVKQTNSDDTLIIVTADHSHVFTMAGYPQRGNPILGKVKSIEMGGLPSKEYQKAKDGKPYTTVGYQNGRGMAYVPGEVSGNRQGVGDINAGRHDLSKVDTENSGYYQEVLVPLESETHGGEDVAIYATGPGAWLISGTHEQNVVFHVMNYAAGLSTAAEKALGQ